MQNNKGRIDVHTAGVNHRFPRPGAPAFAIPVIVA
jgi:hypothetical protein